jgi:flagellin-specific chaperone FliS
MKDHQKQKIQRFLQDEVMSSSVYDVILSSFLKSQGSEDVNVLAAERIAISLLQDAWKELKKNTVIDKSSSGEATNIGV